MNEKNTSNGSSSTGIIFSNYSKNKLEKYCIKVLNGKYKIKMDEKTSIFYMNFLKSEELDFNKYLSKFIEPNHEFT